MFAVCDKNSSPIIVAPGLCFMPKNCLDFACFCCDFAAVLTLHASYYLSVGEQCMYSCGSCT